MNQRILVSLKIYFNKLNQIKKDKNLQLYGINKKEIKILKGFCLVHK